MCAPTFAQQNPCHGFFMNSVSGKPYCPSKALADLCSRVLFNRTLRMSSVRQRTLRDAALRSTTETTVTVYRKGCQNHVRRASANRHPAPILARRKPW
jgi:hypothetical protein